MPEAERQTSIDALRGLAVLLMVMVHAAATWSPANASELTVLATVVSGFGGLAAPLFVTLFGWGLRQRSRTWSERWRQATFLFLCQVGVNLSASHLFQPFTPGVLSLMGLMILSEPLWAAPWRTNRTPFNVFLIVAATMLVFLWFAEPLQGPSNWDARVETATAFDVVSHLLLTGTYPLLPWVLFGAFGGTIALHPGRRPLVFTFAVGMGISAVVLFLALSTNTPWALPTGEAALTFFPANGPFLIAALTGVSLLWLLVDGRTWMNGLAGAGRCSLTLYVAHFLPLFWLHTLDEQGSWTLNLSMAVTVVYTATWMVVGTFWWKRRPHWTLEAAWRRWSRRSNSPLHEQVVRVEGVER